MMFGRTTDLSDDDKRFLYIIETVNRQDDDQKAREIDIEEWRGKIHKIDQNMKQVIRELEERQDKKIDEKIEEIQDTLKKQMYENKELQSQTKSVQDELKETNKKID